jgi:hypothetical protein
MDLRECADVLVPTSNQVADACQLHEIQGKHLASRVGFQPNNHLAARKRAVRRECRSESVARRPTEAAY